MSMSPTEEPSLILQVYPEPDFIKHEPDSEEGEPNEDFESAIVKQEVETNSKELGTSSGLVDMGTAHLGVDLKYCLKQENQLCDTQNNQTVYTDNCAVQIDTCLSEISEIKVEKDKSQLDVISQGSGIVSEINLEQGDFLAAQKQFSDPESDNLCPPLQCVKSESRNGTHFYVVIKPEGTEQVRESSLSQKMDTIEESEIFTLTEGETVASKQQLTEGPHTCNACGKVLSTAGTLRRHQRIHSGQHPYKCTVCEQGFNAPSGLSRHMLKHTGEKPHKCEDCGKGFTSADSLTRHEYGHTGVKPYRCTVCEKVFRREDHLATHQRTHTGEKPYKCKVCGKCFADIRWRNIHQSNHSAEKSHRLTVSGKGHAAKDCLKKHDEVHGEKNLILCEKELSEDDQKSEKIFKCTLCGVAFANSQDSTKHQLTHAVHKPYLCTICGRGFTKKSYLSSHQHTHACEKPQSCNICNKTFIKSSSIAETVSTNNSDRQFKCTICEQGFALLDEVTQHVQTHTGVKPHMCSVCGKGFNYKGNLDAHTRSHTGETPYLCTICNKGFKERSSLKKHQRVHTGEKPYECHICEKKFGFLSGFTRHLNSMHAKK